MSYICFSIFPILSSKDDISFRRELGSAHVKFDRLNQKSNLVVWVDLNRYQVRMLYITFFKKYSYDIFAILFFEVSIWSTSFF